MSLLIVAALVSGRANFSFNTSDHNKSARDNWLWNSHFQLVSGAPQMKYLWVFMALEEPWSSQTEVQRQASYVVPLLHNCIWQGIRAERRFSQSVTFAGGIRNEHSVPSSAWGLLYDHRDFSSYCGSLNQSPAIFSKFIHFNISFCELNLYGLSSVIYRKSDQYVLMKLWLFFSIKFFHMSMFNLVTSVLHEPQCLVNIANLNSGSSEIKPLLHLYLPNLFLIDKKLICKTWLSFRRVKVDAPLLCIWCTWLYKTCLWAKCCKTFGQLVCQNGSKKLVILCDSTLCSEILPGTWWIGSNNTGYVHRHTWMCLKAAVVWLDG